MLRFSISNVSFGLFLCVAWRCDRGLVEVLSQPALEVFYAGGRRRSNRTLVIILSEFQMLWWQGGFYSDRVIMPAAPKLPAPQRVIPMLLRNVNLNLLPILRTLLKTRSVSATANALAMSQPAASDALAKLRDLLGDQLLVRIGGGMKLTSRAESMIEELEQLCGNLEEFLRPDAFDPLRATGEFVVASSDIHSFMLARPMLDLLRSEAPGINLHLIDLPIGLTAKMAAREVAFALLPDFVLNDLAPAPLRFAPLVTLRNVVLMRRGHPLAAKEVLTLNDVAHYPHVRFRPDAVVTRPRNRLDLAAGDVKFNIVARSAQMMLVPHLVIASDQIAVVPRQLCEAMAAVYPLEFRPIPPLELATDLGLAWSPIFDSDPAHRWFRTSLIAEVKKQPSF